MERFDELFSLYHSSPCRITLMSIRISLRVRSVTNANAVHLLLSPPTLALPKFAFILVNSMATTPLASTTSTNTSNSTPLLPTRECA
ncbi:hypothetical protein AAHA92_02185 [Salvia divinorum]|uniref:Uncharacterized protein n=1 Tax=Salvia divinorum TaxID=28513 RepID=A0ABD1IDM4_SALDI